MRFLIWTERFFPDCGGLELSMFRLASELDSRGHFVEIITTRATTPRRAPFTIVEFEPERFLAQSTSYVRAHACRFDCLYLARLAQAREREHLALLRPVAGLIPWVIRMPTTGNVRRVRAADARNLLTHARATLIAQNPHSLRECRRYYPDALAVLSRNTARPPSTHSANYRSFFLFAARVTPSKNLHTLLRAWRQLEAEDRAPWAELRIFGIPYNVPYARECAGIFRTCRRVRYDGYYPSGSYAILDAASFVVIPSFREGHSNVMLEALSVGTPVIASAIPGLEEDLAEECAFVLRDATSADELCELLVRGATLAEPAYVSMSDAARKRGEELFRQTPQPTDVLLKFLNRSGTLSSSLAHEERVVTPSAAKLA